MAKIAALTLAVSLAAFFLLLGGRFLSVYNEVYRDYATSKANADAQEIFREKCLGLATITDISGCFDAAIKSARESQRAEEDLYAQKQMAVWAEWMFYATCFIGIMSIIMGGTGVLLVSRTLGLQRNATAEAAAATRAAIEANEISRDAFLADQRPWVSVDITLSDPPEWGPNGCTVSFCLHLANTGKTPALGVDIHPEINLKIGQYTYIENHSALMKRIRDSGISNASALFAGKQTERYITMEIPMQEMEDIKKSGAIEE